MIRPELAPHLNRIDQLAHDMQKHIPINLKGSTEWQACYFFILRFISFVAKITILMIRLHLHYLTDQKFGPASHAKARKTSISKIYHHVLGMIYWAISVEPTFGQVALEKFNSIHWPPITKVEYFS